MNWKTICKETALFASGFALGVLSVQRYYDKKYKDEVSKKIEELLSEIEPKAEPKTVINKSDASELPAKSEPDMVIYNKTIDELKYTGDKEAKETETYDKPYVISPEEFGEKYDEGYKTVSLTFYSDGFLADEMDEIVENVDELVGAESLNHFGEYEDDSVFVRNDKLKIDYEILLDNRKLVDVRHNSPRPLEDECDEIRD